jgi:hypothetical protein
MKSFLGMFFMRTADVSAQGTLVVVQQLTKFSICSIWEARTILHPTFCRQGHSDLLEHWLDMELDLQSYLSSMYSLAETPQRQPPPPRPIHGLIYEGAIGQPRLTTSLCHLSAMIKFHTFLLKLRSFSSRRSKMLKMYLSGLGTV